MRGRTFGGRPTPQPATNPPEPSHSHSEHRLGHDPIFDIDGPSVSEDEAVDGPVACVIREVFTCRRDGCEASDDKRHIYALNDFSERVQQSINYASNDEYDEAEVEYAAMNVDVVDHDGEYPIVGIQFGDDTLGYLYPTETMRDDDTGGECYGHEDEATRLGI